MAQRPKVSIIVPCYNSEKYLKECLDSILKQTFQDYELILIDNGSIDRTKDIIEVCKIMNKNKNIRFFYINKSIGGSARTINLGLSIAQGDYLTWVSSDDHYYSDDDLGVMVKFLDINSEVSLVSGRYKQFGEYECVVGVDYNKVISFEMMKQSNHIGGGFLFRRECFEEIGYMREDLIGAEDWDYWIRLSKHFEVFKMRDVVYCWRKHDKNMSANPERIKEINENVRKVQNGVY